MKDLAQRGKTSTGWFYGFKLHLVLNDRGEFTPGNTDDHTPVEALTRNLWGLLLGAKGYLSQPLVERLFVSQRAIIETVIDQLKNIQQIEPSRHRSPVNYFVDIIAGLVTYPYGEKLPSLNLDPRERLLLHDVAG